MMDLLGADLPVEGGLPAEFAWADGPLLAALKAGDWVLLDELNLAGTHLGHANSTLHVYNLSAMKKSWHQAMVCTTHAPAFLTVYG